MGRPHPNCASMESQVARRAHTWSTRQWGGRLRAWRLALGALMRKARGERVAASLSGSALYIAPVGFATIAERPTVHPACAVFHVKRRSSLPVLMAIAGRGHQSLQVFGVSGRCRPGGVSFQGVRSFHVKHESGAALGGLRTGGPRCPAQGWRLAGVSRETVRRRRTRVSTSGIRADASTEQALAPTTVFSSKPAA